MFIKETNLRKINARLLELYSKKITLIGKPIKHISMNVSNNISDLEIKKVWNEIAESFDRSRSETWKQCIDYIDSLPKESRVVELGCGSGRHMIPCAQKIKFVYGLDISDEMLKITKKKLDEGNITANLIQGNVVMLPLKNDSFNAGLFIATLHHLSPKAKRLNALLEVKRILKPGGTMLISVWARYQDRFLWHFVLDFFMRIFKKNNDEFGNIFVDWVNENLKIPRFHHLFSSNELKQLVLDSGLKIVNMSEAKIGSSFFPDNYFILVKKNEEQLKQKLHELS